MPTQEKSSDIYARRDFRVFTYDKNRKRHLEFGTDRKPAAVSRAQQLADRARMRRERYARALKNNRYGNHLAIPRKDATVKVTIVDADGVTVMTIPIAA